MPDSAPTPADYLHDMRMKIATANLPAQTRADGLNLLEDIFNLDRSVDEVVNDFLEGKTPVVYRPQAK